MSFTENAHFGVFVVHVHAQIVKLLDQVLQILRRDIVDVKRDAFLAQRGVDLFRRAGGVTPVSRTPARSSRMGARAFTLVGPSCGSTVSTSTRRYLTLSIWLMAVAPVPLRSGAAIVVQ
jgi:hypothetical protein